MCVTPNRSNLSARDAIEAYNLYQSSNVQEIVEVWHYANDCGSYSLYPVSASKTLLEEGYKNGSEYVEYTFNSMLYVIYFDRNNNKTVQINRTTGQTRLLVRLTPLVVKLDIPVSYATHIWTVESKDMDNPAPYKFYADGQADLEAAYSLYITGGSHIYGHENLVINFEEMIQTSIPNLNVSKLYRRKLGL